jgi:hypothetical protein
MKILSGNLQVWQHGIVFTNKHFPITFDLDPELKITLKFIDDHSTTESSTDFKAIDSNTGQIILTNYNNVLGTGVPEPYRIGNIGDIDIYFAFWIYRVHEQVANKKVEFTFFKQVSNGN